MLSAFVLFRFVKWLGIALFAGGLTLAASPASPRARTRLMTLERWAMADVFVLALWLVYTKVAGIAEVVRLPGYWAMIAAGLLSLYCAFRLRRVY